MTKTVTFSPRLQQGLYILGAVAILAGFIFTILSWLHICSEACEGGHSYRLFGMPFEAVGLVYFIILAIFYALSAISTRFTFITGILIAGGLGAESIFVLFQKTVLYHWCPICLSIASSLLILALTFATETLINLFGIIKKGDIMKIKSTITNILVALAVFVIGAASAFGGITKHDSIAIAETSLNEKIAFGKQDSPITVYMFTSWSCPACKHLEPTLANVVTPLEQKAKIIFIDHVSDVKTLNYAPYNLSFMLNNKKQYFELRKVLREVGAKTDAPTEEQVEKAVGKIHEKYKQLNYADVEIGIGYFKEMSNVYEISSLPSVVIVNSKTKEHKMLSGTEKVTSAHILDIINDMQKEIAFVEENSERPENHLR